jgi:hypothetical protein
LCARASIYVIAFEQFGLRPTLPRWLAVTENKSIPSLKFSQRHFAPNRYHDPINLNHFVCAMFSNHCNALLVGRSPIPNESKQWPTSAINGDNLKNNTVSSTQSVWRPVGQSVGQLVVRLNSAQTSTGLQRRSLSMTETTRRTNCGTTRPGPSCISPQPAPLGPFPFPLSLFLSPQSRESFYPAACLCYRWSAVTRDSVDSSSLINGENRNCDGFFHLYGR